MWYKILVEYIYLIPVSIVEDNEKNNLMDVDGWQVTSNSEIVE